MEERITLEGIVEKVNFEYLSEGRESDIFVGYCLYVLIQGDDGTLYNTFIEREGDEDSPAIHHLQQLYDRLHIASISNQRVRVTVVKQDDKKDMPLYRVVKPYQILSKETKSK